MLRVLAWRVCAERAWTARARDWWARVVIGCACSYRAHSVRVLIGRVCCVGSAARDQGACVECAQRARVPSVRIGCAYRAYS